ncbi:uncharacterized protein YdgA (DUF945 family) [Sinobacterium caligoides]|uniref:Uncharacterized protein YdgA (DUF945 family) n=1 Tax=Sinobacterium caligoides TaxID=933926 RepID=A0A3N2DZV5_9GAMM|nr:DUF945 family protein [Sinobacterium caligoides]ROS04845.1 uncharacterized protein YdgA (DUF945 family) [Sinobacterium caligoides]
MKTPVIVTSALIVAGLAIAPKFVGNAVENRLEDMVKTLNRSPMLEVSLSDYNKSWFSSDAVINVTFHGEATAGAGEDDFTVKLPLSVAHGPVIFDGAPSLDWVKWHLEVETGEQLKTLLRWDDSQPLYQFSGSVGLLQKIDFSERLLPFEIDSEAGVVKFSGYQGQGEGRGVVQYEGGAESLLIPIEGGSVVAKGLHVNFETELDLDKFVDGKLSNMSANFSLDQLDVGELFALKKLMVDVSSDYDAKTKLADATVAYSAAEVTVAEHTASDLALEIEVKNISDEFNDFYSEQLEQLDDSALEAENMQALLLKSLPLLLKNDPEFNIKKLAVTLPEGSFIGHANLAVKGVNADNIKLEDNAFWLQHTVFDSSFTADKPLAEKIATEFFTAQQANQQQAPQDMAEARQMAQQQASMTLMMLAGQGMLQDLDKTFKIDFSFNKGEVNLNGKAMPLPPGLIPQP